MAGSCALVRLQFHDALNLLTKAKQAADRNQNIVEIQSIAGNLAALYLQMGNSAAAYHIVKDALAARENSVPNVLTAKLEIQMAISLEKMHRFDEAARVYSRALPLLEEHGELQIAASAWEVRGGDALDEGHLADAEAALDHAMQLIRRYGLQERGTTLRELARCKELQGKHQAAAELFDAAVAEPPDTTPKWLAFADRGDFRLARGDNRGALDDFRAARALVASLHSDVVPSDQDRTLLESDLDRVSSGLVEAGNRIAIGTADARLLAETFDAAEQDRLWSLRALTRSTDDWRTRLPSEYWDVLARYRAFERSVMSGTREAAAVQQANSLRLQLNQMEANAGSDRGDQQASALRHARAAMDGDSVLLSFHKTAFGLWLWAVTKDSMSVYRLPAPDEVQRLSIQLVNGIQHGTENGEDTGSRLYRALFGKLEARYSNKGRWLLGLDDPLYEIPFSALVVEKRGGVRSYLGEKVAIQSIPGALMLQAAAPFRMEQFLGIADPVYNGADARFGAHTVHPEFVLPRLPAGAREVAASSRAAEPARTTVLTGMDASPQKLDSALRLQPSVIHFATHVVSPLDSAVPAPRENASGVNRLLSALNVRFHGAMDAEESLDNNFKSGLIALSLEPNGNMALLGPDEIRAHHVDAQLVVLNGCHSARASTLPGSGLMGLTRAWIGAGANAVLATRWEVPDDRNQAMMIAFYRALRQHPERSPAYALKHAQEEMLKDPDARRNPAIWASYFLLARS